MHSIFIIYKLSKFGCFLKKTEKLVKLKTMTTKRIALLKRLKSKKPKPIYKLDKLPADIIGFIATFLSQKHYAHFECVNSTIYIGINNNSKSSKLRALQLTYDHWSHQQIIEILKYHTNFEQLEINSDYLYLFKSCTENLIFRNLKKLEITITPKTDQGFFEFMNLQKLWNYQQLTSLALWGWKTFNISLMYKAISMCCNLKNLVVSDCYESNTMELELPHLQCLKLSSSLAFEIVKSCGHQLKQLDYWNIDAWAHSNGSPYENIQRAEILTEINFSKLLKLKFDAVHFNEIEAIIQTAKNLQFLHMTNDSHDYPVDGQQTIKNLVEVIFTKCTKLEHICLDFLLDMDISMEQLNPNSPILGYTGLITGLQQTVSVHREKLQIDMIQGMLSLKQLGEILNAFKKGNTKTMIICYFKGCIADNNILWEESVNKPMKFIESVIKQSLTDSSLYSHSFNNVKKDRTGLEFQLTLHKKI